MRDGRIVQQGTKGQVLTPPHHPYTDLLLSSVPEMATGWLDNLLAERARRKARGEQLLESAD
jgi:peptide/nickel transport system ATP-binding protein